jgi:hypothetical protein
MLLAFSAMNRSPVFTASALDDTETMTSDHGAARSPNAPEALPSIDDDDAISAPEGYTRYTPDPSLASRRGYATTASQSLARC